MPYSAPTTITTAQLVTAALMNTDWVENIKFLANPPACRVTKAAAQLITTGTNTAITFDTERYDTASMHDTVTLNTRITIPVAGLYQVGGNIQWQASATGVRSFGVRLNGSTFISNVQADTDSVIQHRQNVDVVYKFVVGDYVELVIYHTNGADLNCEKADAYSPEFFATWLGLG